jgi:hypothetical protein
MGRDFWFYFSGQAIPLGSLAGAAAINLSGSVTGVYAVIGGLTAAIALVFAFSPVADGDRYLAEAAEQRAGSAGAGHSPGVAKSIACARQGRRPLRGPR